MEQGGTAAIWGSGSMACTAPCKFGVLSDLAAGMACALATDMHVHTPLAPQPAPLSPPPRNPRIEQHLDLVYAIAAGVCRRTGGAADRDDLVSAGFTGLVEAGHRYRPGHGATFATFAYYRVAGAMGDQLRAVPSPHGCTGEPADAVEDPTPAADALLAARDALAALARALAALPPRERRLVERCFFDGVSLKIAAGELGLSTSRASRLRHRAVASLRSAVRDAIGA